MIGHQPPGPAAVIVQAGEVKTLLAALDEVAEYKRDRAATCADCADQACATCQWRLQAADTYDQVAAQLIHAANASATWQCAPGKPAAARRRPARDHRPRVRTVTLHPGNPCTVSRRGPVTP